MSGGTEATTVRTPRLRVRKDKTNPRRLAFLALLLFAVPPPLPLLALGAVLAFAGIFLHGWAAGYLARAGYSGREKLLTARGPYRHNRNPYYLAHLTMDLGFFLMAGLPWAWLLYIPVSFPVYRRWVLNEERFLVEEFGDDYRAFKQDVPRWGFRLTPARARGHEQRFEWSMYLRNHETHRTVSHLFLLAAFAAYFLLGNPFADVPVPVRATVLAAAAGWLAVHDIFPLHPIGISRGWLLAAAGIAAGAVALLVGAPAWSPWPPPAARTAALAGLVIVLYLAVTVTPFFRQRAGKRGVDLFARPLCQWYILALGLGLVSARLGGLWLGIALCMTAWSLGLAGVWTPRGIPQRYAASIAIIILAALAAWAGGTLIP